MEENIENYLMWLQLEHLSTFPILLEYGVPLLKVHGHLIAMRGFDDSTDGINALKVLNSKINGVLEFKLPYEE